MKKLSLPDSSFLLLEKRQQPTHVAGLQLFSYPDGAPRDFLRALADEFRNVDQVAKPFNQKLVRRFGQYWWAEDPYFDLSHHFRHSALPKPGRIRELLDLVSRLQGNLLDRSRPLWESRLIEGLQGRKFAMYNKIHHSVVDGVAAIQLGQAALTDDPEVRSLPPMWAKRKNSEPYIRKQRSSHRGSIIRLEHLREAAGMSRGLSGPLMDYFTGHDGMVSPFEAPRSLLNVPITASRRFAAQSYSLPRIRAVGKKLNATVNDIVLAICAHALRTYLQEMNALPEKSLIASIPVSVRPEGVEGGNQVTFILANLGTSLADPLDRIEVIKESVMAGKRAIMGLNQSEVVVYTLLTNLPLLKLALGIAPEVQPFNLVISNVPGPRKPLYWNGARLEGTYPVSIVMAGQALNITCVSYVDQIDFGIIACRRSLPSIQRMLDYLEDGLKQLEQAAA